MIDRLQGLKLIGKKKKKKKKIRRILSRRKISIPPKDSSTPLLSGSICPPTITSSLFIGIVQASEYVKIHSKGYDDLL